MAQAAQRRSDNGMGPLVNTVGLRSGSDSRSGANRDGGYYDRARPSQVIGQFNGRGITKAESEYRGGMLPTAPPGYKPFGGPGNQVFFEPLGYAAQRRSSPGNVPIGDMSGGGAPSPSAGAPGPAPTPAETSPGYSGFADMFSGGVAPAGGGGMSSGGMSSGGMPRRRGSYYQY